MKPTPCYRVAGYAITDAVQLDYLKRYFTYMDYYMKSHIKDILKQGTANETTYAKKIPHFERVMREGLYLQPLIKRAELNYPSNHYPDVMVALEEGVYYFREIKPLVFKEEGFYQPIGEVSENFPSFTLASIKSIKHMLTEDENEKIYRDKKINVKTVIQSHNSVFNVNLIVVIKENTYLCVERVFTNDAGRVIDYLIHTNHYQNLFFQQFFNRKIDLALLGHGDLLKYKDLPVITMPKAIEEIKTI